MSKTTHQGSFAKQRLDGQKLAKRVERKNQEQEGEYPFKLAAYKKLNTKFNGLEPTTKQRVIGTILLAMIMGNEFVKLAMIVNEGNSKLRQRSKPSDSENKRRQHDYEILQEDLKKAPKDYEEFNISEKNLKAAEIFLEQIPEIDPAKLASDTADFESRSEGLASISDIHHFVETTLTSYTQTAITAGIIAAAVGGNLASTDHLVKSPYEPSLKKVSALAIAALAAFLPAANAQQDKTLNREEIVQLFTDIERITKNKKKLGFFSTLKYHFNLQFGSLPPLWDKVPQNYKEDASFMEFMQAAVSLTSLATSGTFARSSLANEAYLQTAAFIEVLYDSYGFEMSSARDKEIITQAIFVNRDLASADLAFDHGFFHLLGVPMSQGKAEAENYQSLLKVIKDFISKSGLPIEQILWQDSQGNSPLHVMAAVAPLNQFKLFYETFADLIPEKMWNEKNGHGHSARDILENNDIQKEAINYVSEAMRSNFNIHTSANSPSDVLHKPGSMEVHHDPSMSKEIVIPKSRGKLLASYPKSAYVKQKDGSYAVKDLLNDKVLEMIPAAQYDEVELILPTGTSYAALAFESREKKLQIVKEKMHEKKPAIKVASADASKLSQANEKHRRNDEL